MEQNLIMDDKTLRRLDGLAENWAEHRRDLTLMIYFSLAVIILIFINIDKFTLVASSPVVKVIDVFAMLLLIVVPVWGNFELNQGDAFVKLLKDLNVRDFNADDTALITQIRLASEYTQVAEKGYPFMLLIAGVGIFLLNVIAFIVYGPVG